MSVYNTGTFGNQPVLSPEQVLATDIIQQFNGFQAVFSQGTPESAMIAQIKGVLLPAVPAEYGELVQGKRNEEGLIVAENSEYSAGALPPYGFTQDETGRYVEGRNTALLDESNRRIAEALSEQINLHEFEPQAQIQDNSNEFTGQTMQPQAENQGEGNIINGVPAVLGAIFLKKALQ